MADTPMVVLPDQVPGESRSYSTMYGRNAEAMEKESIAYAVQDGEAIIENERKPPERRRAPHAQRRSMDSEALKLPKEESDDTSWAPNASVDADDDDGGSGRRRQRRREVVVDDEETDSKLRPAFRAILLIT